jgi:hypothetical protein
MTEDVADRIHRLDPTRSVLRTAPERT